MSRFVSDPTAATTAFFARDSVAVIDSADVVELGRLALEVEGPVRYSLHADRTDELHCMAILQPQGVYAQPRKHRTKAKVFHLISGEMIVVTFLDDGAVRTLHHLAPGGTLIVRIAPGITHTNYSLSTQAVYHEVISGPFEPDSDERLFATFAPSHEDQKTGRAWMRALIERERPDLFTTGFSPGSA